ncbi:MAG: alpha/beta hydrolase [Syntrophomonadaceae bacterium]
MFHAGAKLALSTGVTIRSVTAAGSRRRRYGGEKLAVARSFLSALSSISDRACGICAELAFRTPPRFSATRREELVLASASRSWVRGPAGEIAMWHWGDGPRVLLAHGWGSHAGRLTPFVERLLGCGFGVTAFDAPGHGESPARFSSLPDFADALRRVSRAVCPVALVGHSMGAAACVLALDAGVRARAAVLLAPPADPGAYTRRYARWLGLSEAAAEIMRRRLERRYGGTLDSYRLVDRDPGVPTLILHDRGDTRVPVEDGRALAAAWSGARLVETRGLGHHRILRAPAVGRRMCRFLTRTIFAPREATVARFLKPPMLVHSRATIGGLR